ncbi:prepilin peptidase [Candidatus Woesearchaeota archaeon]|nr:prepilin peptidase [Candidatus Woesearchaeota archaeon]
MDLVAQLVIVLGLVIGTYTDLRTREVPDWLNFGLIGAGLGLGTLFSLLSWTWQPFISSVFGLVLGVIIGYLMFYAGQWGGGDAKMIMGLGALFGLSVARPLSFEGLPSFIVFIVNVVIIGALYGVAWAVIMGFRQGRLLRQAYMRILRQRRLVAYRAAVIAASVLSLLLAFLVKGLVFRVTFVAFAFIIFFTFHLWVLGKALEQACMLKRLPVGRLTEGDWVADDVWVPRKRFVSVLVHLRRRQEARLALACEHDAWLSLYRQLGWGRCAAARERRLSHRHVKPDEELLRLACKGFSGRLRIVVAEALRGSKALLLAADRESRKEGKPLLEELRTRFRYDPDEKYLTGPKELGITHEQIALAKRHGVKEVLVKEGIPFVPSFLLAYVVTVLFGNWLSLLF